VNIYNVCFLAVLFVLVFLLFHFFVSSAVCINCLFHILFIMFSAVIETFLQSSPDVGIIAV